MLQSPALSSEHRRTVSLAGLCCSFIAVALAGVPVAGELPKYVKVLYDNADRRIINRNIWVSRDLGRGLHGHTLADPLAVALFSPVVSCPWTALRSIQVNDTFYGGRWTCGLPEAALRSSPHSPPCVILSFGAGTSTVDVFERHVLSVDPSCIVHIFDPAVPALGGIYNHHDYGVCGGEGAVNGVVHINGSTYPCKPMAQILEEIDAHHVQIVKLDLEGGEWDVIRSTDWLALNIGQLLVELHEPLQPLTVEELSSLIWGPLESAGFLQFSIEPVCDRCPRQLQVGFINRYWDPEMGVNRRPPSAASLLPPPAAPDFPPMLASRLDRPKHLKAIVTLLLPPREPSDAAHYRACMHLFLASLRKTTCTLPVIVMALKGDDSVDWLHRHAATRNVEIARVHRMSVDHEDGNVVSRYRDQYTKLHAFRMEAEQVLYYDSDMVFLGDPTPALDECGEAPFCAVGDPGILNIYVNESEKTYFNGGFFALRPDRRVFDAVVNMMHWGDEKMFVEQDVLNMVFRGRWKPINPKYNWQHQGWRGIPKDTLVIHEKLEPLREEHTEPTWPWNDPDNFVDPERRRRKLPEAESKYYGVPEYDV